MARGDRKRGGGISPLGSVLRGLGSVRIPSGVEASPVSTRDWEAAVGSRIAARARPIKLERGVLYVRAATSTWSQELSLLADAIVEQLRGRGVEVRSLRFVVGVVEAPARPPSRDDVRKAPADAPLPPDVAELLERMPDDDLRDAIARAAAKNLGWQLERARTPPKVNRRRRP